MGPHFFSFAIHTGYFESCFDCLVHGVVKFWWKVFSLALSAPAASCHEQLLRTRYLYKQSRLVAHHHLSFVMHNGCFASWLDCLADGVVKFWWKVLSVAVFPSAHWTTTTHYLYMQSKLVAHHYLSFLMHIGCFASWLDCLTHGVVKFWWKVFSLAVFPSHTEQLLCTTCTCKVNWWLITTYHFWCISVALQVGWIVWHMGLWSSDGKCSLWQCFRHTLNNYYALLVHAK